jgi:hypothetical protein
MRPVDILEWTMGWPWPVMIVFGALIAWGISRLMMWDEQGTEDQLSGSTPCQPCACTCD